MRLISDFPWYFFLLCLLIGAAYGAALYLVGRGNSLSKTTRWVLASLRFLSASLIACLLLAPLVRRDTNQREKPIVVIAQDNSQSVLMCRDSAYYRNEYAHAMERLRKTLAGDYDVRCLTYGEKVADGDAPLCQESATDISALLSDVANRFEGRNVGALILTGDGIFNQGLNPVSMTDGMAYPVYTVALGDTSVRRDACIANLRHNRIAYMGNQFPMEITVRASQLKGCQKVLSVSHEGKTVFSKTLTYSDNDYAVTEQVLLDATRAGLQTYTVAIAPAEDEVSVRNNSRSVTVEVIDGHRKVAIVAAAPHPDVAALRRSLEDNPNYEVSSFLASDFREQPSQYSLIIFHNLPSAGAPLPPSLSPLPPTVPAIFVLGSQTDLSRFNSLHLGLEIFSKISRQNESTPLYNNNFTLFTLDDGIRRQIEHFPPLGSPFGDYRLSGNTQSLFTARVGSVNSGLPLVAFTQRQGARYGFVAGEGLWKWSMADYRANQSHEAFNTLVNKMVVYTSMQEGRDRFHIEAKPVYRSGEAVTLEATLYNDNYELVNTPEVVVDIQNAEGKTSSYSFNRTSDAYSLNVGTLQPGRYSFKSQVSFGASTLSSAGSFVVEALQLEDLDLVADHALLNTLASTTGGQMLPPQDIDQLPQLLKQRDDIKTVIYSRTRYTELLNLPLVFILVIVLLGAEWAARKYHGER